LEAGGDICVNEADKERLVAELYRVLRPGGHVGFSDLAPRTCPTAAEDRALRALLYHAGAELLTDWPALFARHGFRIVECRDILNQTLPTWEHAQAVYHHRDGGVTRRYCRRLANRILAQLERIPAVLATHGTYPALTAHSPSKTAEPARRHQQAPLLGGWPVSRCSGVSVGLREGRRRRGRSVLGECRRVRPRQGRT
jgi:hypothetical protein